MSKSNPFAWRGETPSGLPQSSTEAWQQRITAVARRFDQSYRQEPFDLPPEVEAMPIFRDWTSGALAAKVASPFWELAKPRKNQHCLDLGCGVSFLIYPWLEWQAFFHGQEISRVAQQTLTARGPQLNSKLFKGVKLAPAHQLEYAENSFDLVIATGFSCYYGLEYWQTLMEAVRRVLKPDGFFVFDVLDPEAPLAENWAILETYLGAEVFLDPLSDWKATLQAAKAQVVKQLPGDAFHLYKVKWA